MHDLPRDAADGMLLRITPPSWLSASRLSARRRYFIAGSGRPSTLCAHPVSVQACGNSGMEADGGMPLFMGEQMLRGRMLIGEVEDRHQ